MLQNNPAGELELALRIRALVEGQNAIVGLGASFLDINRSVEQLMLGLRSVSGSLEAANSEFAFLTSVALKTGLAIETLGSNYLKLTAASKGTVMEGERSRELFAQTSDALMKLGSDSVNTTRAINALAQMMSKGQIYSEELKGQLSEAIPGALNIMSRALGLSVQEMLNLMEQGLLTSDALVLFGNQLKTEFTGSSESVRTFNQVINDVINQWTLLMKGIGDTGTWSALKTIIGGLAGNMTVLSTAAGAAAGVGLFKLAAGIKNIIVSSKEYVAASAVSVAAHRLEASAALDSAKASLAAATASAAEARATVQAAEAQMAQVAGTGFASVALRSLNVAKADAAIKTGAMIAAESALVRAQSGVIASTGLFARSLGVLFGPVGMIATAIASAAYFAFSFKDVGEKSEIAKQSLDEYAKSVNDVSTKELIAAIAILDAAEKEEKASAQKLQSKAELAKVEEDYIERMGRIFFSEQQLADAQANSIKLANEAAGAQSKQEEVSAKLNLTRAAIIGRLGEMYNSESSLIGKTTELRDKQDALHETTERLRLGVENGTVSYQEYYAAQMNEIENSSKLRIANEQLYGTIAQLTQIENVIQKQAEDNVAAYAGLTKGSTEYNAAIVDEAQRIRECYHELSQLAEKVAAAEIATRNLKAQTEAHATASKAIIAVLETESKLTADTTQQRQLLLTQRQTELTTEKEQVVLMLQEQASIQANLALKQREIELGTAKEKQVLEEIGSLKNQLIAKNAEIEARKKNIEALNLEKIAAESAGTMMSAAMKDVENDIRMANEALAEQKEARIQASMAGKLASELIPLDENILLLERRIADLSKEKAIIMKQGWESIGQSQEEAATGMDFQTRKMINSFGELAGKGQLTSQQLTASFTDVLQKANTTSELSEIAVQLVNLKDTGKYSTDLINQMMAEVALKMSDVAKSADPVTIALQKMGLGVPENLKAIAEEMKAQVDILTPQRVGVEASNNAFMKYAEVLINAKLAGANVDLQQLKIDASSRGLGTSVTALYEKLKQQHDGAQQLTSSLAALKDMTERNARENELAATATESYHNANIKLIDAAIRVAKAKGDETKASELQIEKNTILVQQANAIAQLKAQEVADAKTALSVKTLELAKDGELTAAEQEQIAVLENLVVVKKNAAAEAQANATAMEAEAAAAKNVASAAKESKDNIDLANESFKQTGKDLDNVNASYAKFRDISAVAFGVEGIAEYEAIIKDIQSAIDEANTQAQRLADEGMAAATGNAGALAAELQNSQSYLNDAAHAAADNLVNALEDAQEAAGELREELAGVATDYSQKILELVGDDYTSLLVDRGEALADLEEKYGKAGQTATKAYIDAKNAVIAYYDVKLAKAKEDAAADKTAQNTTQMQALARATAEAEAAATRLANTNLTALISQSDTLSNNMKSLWEFL